jgi:hypothetical protein
MEVMQESVDIIICDNIRMELGGKLSLMGVTLNNTIVVPTIPCSLPTLSFLLRLKKCTKDFLLSISITTPDKKQIDPIKKQKIAIPQKNISIFFNFTIAPFKITSDGTYIINILFDDNLNPAFSQSFRVMKAKKKELFH